MTDIEYIAANLSIEDILCQIAEEAAELSKAALKLRRVLTGTNPTPVSYEDAIYNLIEEYTDTVVAFMAYAKKSEIDTEVYELSNENIESKFYRWAKRIKEGKKRD